MTYGQSITWYEREGSATVTVSGVSTPEMAMRECLKSAMQMGWTRPKWYQWWRWQERRLPKGAIEEVEAELLEVLVK